VVCAFFVVICGCTKQPNVQKPNQIAVQAVAVKPAEPPAPVQALPGQPDFARGPIIDSHTLITPLDESIKTALALFSKVGVVKFCNKNGGYLGSPLFDATLRVKHELKDRFEFFANLDWEGVEKRGWARREADRLEHEIALGAKGLKIFKSLGLSARDAKGKLIAVDDPSLDPIFERAGRLNAIVALHVGDPKAFFLPPTPDNERYDELSLAPDWSFYGGDYPSQENLLKQQINRIKRHPKTTFLLIHFGNDAEDLDYVERLLATYPNVYTDISARVPEIGRHPANKVRDLFIRFQDRILFGTDLALSPDNMQLGSVSTKPETFDDAVEFYRKHFRFLESDEKQIDHPTPIQGRWKIDAINLPMPVLRKVYYDNAERLIFQRKVGLQNGTAAK
jgi:predicted TIM-barrel fold metal-dependent hydrolase